MAEKLAGRMTEILGRPVVSEVVFAQVADTDVSVEFDCEIDGSQIPEEVRIYLAESALHILESSPLTREGSAEVWIRQGQPETITIENQAS